MLTEIDKFFAFNTALDSKLLAVMMSTHARLGAGSGLRVLDDRLVTMICDVVCRESKASSLLDEGDVEEEEDADSGSLLDGEDEEQGEDSDGWGEEEEEEEDEEEEDEEEEDEDEDDVGGLHSSKRSRFRVFGFQGLGFGVWGLGFWIWGLWLPGAEGAGRC